MLETADEAVERLDDIGGPHSHCNFPWGWAQAGNTPLKWYKQNTHDGGVHDPADRALAGSGSPDGETTARPVPSRDRHRADHPRGSRARAARHGAEGPTRCPSTASAWRRPSTIPQPPHREHRPVLRDARATAGSGSDGWKAVTHHEPGVPFDDDDWELYHLDEDFSEARQPGRRRAGAARRRWSTSGGGRRSRNGVLPLDDRGLFALFAASRRPGMPSARNRFVYRPPISHIVADACAPVVRGWTTDDRSSTPTGKAATGPSSRAAA